MNKLIKKILAIFILFSMLLCLSGCYDATGIEELAYVVAIGLDLSDNNDLELSLQIATGSSSSGGSSSEGSSQSTQANVTTVKCTSIDSGIALINNHISKKTNLSHCQVIVMSEKVAAVGISEYVDTLLNNIELRNDCGVIISKCDAKDYINNVQPSLESLVARFYESTLNSAKYTGYTTNISLAEIYSKIKDTSCEPYAILGAVSSSSSMDEKAKLNVDTTAGNIPIKDDDIIDDFGVAVFHGDKLIGELTGLDSLCHAIINNELEECTISVPSPFENGKYLDLIVTTEKNTNCSVEFINGTPLIYINIFLNAKGLSLDKNIKYDSTDSLHLIKQFATNYITNQVNSYLYKTSKSLKSDICGFGRFAIKHYKTIDEWENSKWLDNYKNSSFKVSVSVNMESGNLFNKS